ncbi:MAG: phosphotransferase family protein [Pseudomonadota bacterium]
MSDRQNQFSGTKEVASAHQFDVARLREYLRAEVPELAGDLGISQFKGGQSNPTYKIESGERAFVLRRKPPGTLLPSAHAVDREYRILSALHAAEFPVPSTYCLCEDESVIGTMFYLMEFVDGRIFWDLDLPESNQEERAAIYDSMNQTLASLHNFDYEGAGLIDFGKPGNYFSRQIKRWSSQYYASETQKLKSMDSLIDWLGANVPGDDSSSIVHGDFRLDNVIIHPTEPKVLAVLDCELSTIGHPLADFTYHLMGWQMEQVGMGSAGLKGKDLAKLGIPDEDEYVALYSERTGRAGGIENRDFYSAFNFFRIAAILQGIAGRVRDGTAASAHAAQSAAAVEPLATIGWAYAKRAGA